MFDTINDSVPLPQVAHALAVAPMCIYRAVWCGRLPAYKIGARWFIQREAAREYIRKSKKAGK